MNAKILVVEDEAALSDAYRLILRGKKYKVAVAEDGNEALKKADEFQPDLILLDLRMPRASGIDFLRNYNSAESHPNVKIIIFSNLDTQKEIDEAYNLGAHRYILKAWASPKELIKIVDDALK